MNRGLFGKLQTKRDFISHGLPRSFSSVWEPWIQGAVASSRMRLGEQWRDSFLTAPIWRFWLGTEICGAPALGAVMPSMDGVGRYFPLTVVFFGESTDAAAPPDIDPRDEWFAVIEDFLLETLEQDRSFEATISALAALPSPPEATRGAEAPTVLLPQGATLARAGGASFAEAFAATRRADAARVSTTYWWTAGGAGYDRLALTAQRLPDPILYAGMMTGLFDTGPTPDHEER